jgi:predicted MFS family arabinose efflux permease
VVNIGSFTGKTIVAPIRIEMGVGNVPFFSAAAALLALLIFIWATRRIDARTAG